MGGGCIFGNAIFNIFNDYRTYIELFYLLYCLYNSNFFFFSFDMYAVVAKIRSKSLITREVNSMPFMLLVIVSFYFG